MQKDWERRYDFVALEADQLNAFLFPVFSDKRVTSVELLTSGLVNTNYKIRVAGFDEAFVLRFYVRDPAACSRDRAIFELVQATVPVPELLYAHPSTSEDELSYVVMKWVDGVLLSEVMAAREETALAECAYDTGKTLAAIGQHTFSQAGFFGPDLTIASPFATLSEDFFLYLKHYLLEGQAGRHLGPALRDRLWRLVQDNQNLLSAQDGVASLVHSDFKGFNILVHQTGGHWRVSAVLDWEFAFAGSPLCDIGNMLRYEHLHPPVFEERFIQGFLDYGGSLPPAWKKTTKLVDLLSLCQFLDSPTSGAALQEEVMGLIMRMMERWQEYPA